MTSHEDELQRASEIADAQLGVAEEFAWPVAGLAAALAYVTLHSWLWAIAAFIGGFALSTYSCRKRAAQAEDAYFKAAGLGTHARIHNPISDKSA